MLGNINLVTYLVELLRDGHEDGKAKAVWCLANLACEPFCRGAAFSSTTSLVYAVSEDGKKPLLSNINLVDYLVEVLRDGSEETKFHSARCLANLAG